MSLGDNLNYFLSNEFIIGKDHPQGLNDTINRALIELIEKFDSGNADTQVTRNHIKINNATDITAGVVTDDVVYFDESTNKWIKAVDLADGIIDVENQIVYIFGLYTFNSKNDLVPGTKYYLDLNTPGTITESKSSGILIGRAFTTNTILNVTTGGGGEDGTPDPTGKAGYELGTDGSEALWTPFRTNPTNVTEDITIPTGQNASIVGPYTIEGTLTVSDGSVLVIL